MAGRGSGQPRDTPGQQLALQWALGRSGELLSPAPEPRILDHLLVFVVFISFQTVSNTGAIKDGTSAPLGKHW